MLRKVVFSQLLRRFKVGSCCCCVRAGDVVGAVVAALCGGAIAVIIKISRAGFAAEIAIVVAVNGVFDE